jgi:hypothetical protein
VPKILRQILKQIFKQTLLPIKQTKVQQIYLTIKASQPKILDSKTLPKTSLRLEETYLQETTTLSNLNQEIIHLQTLLPKIPQIILMLNNNLQAIPIQIQYKVIIFLISDLFNKHSSKTVK